MSRISKTFDDLKKKGSAAYIPYVCAGDPDYESSLRLAKTLCESGADILELGLPFSDPIADGPVIQGAMMRSLSSGFRVNKLFEMIASLRNSGIDNPIIVMTYVNPIIRIGVEKFCTKLSESGADGLLVVDLPIEESAELDSMLHERHLDSIRLIAPNTRDSRIDTMISKTSGFVYAVSVSGITGSRDRLPESALSFVKRVVARTNNPIALGFGISNPTHVKEAVKAGASAVVEGSRLISIYQEDAKSEDERLKRIGKHVREMKAATSMN